MAYLASSICSISAAGRGTARWNPMVFDHPDRADRLTERRVPGSGAGKRNAVQEMALMDCDGGPYAFW